MTDDFSAWLLKVKAAVDSTGNKFGIARWLAHRLGVKPTSVNTKLHKMLGQGHEPRGAFVATVNAWLEAGCPVVQPESDGRKHVSTETKKSRASQGGTARASTLTKEERRAIGKKARAARKSP